MTSADYDANHALSQTSFATVQNKVHYAIHGQTAAAVLDLRIADTFTDSLSCRT